MGSGPMNAPNMDVTQQEKVNEHHQNVIESVAQRDPIVFLTTRQ